MLARDWRAFVSLPFGFSVPFGDFDIFRGLTSAPHMSAFRGKADIRWVDLVFTPFIAAQARIQHLSRRFRANGKELRQQ